MRAFRLLSFRRLRHQPLRAVIAIVAVAAGVALGVAILVTTASIQQSVRDFGRSLAGPADLRIVGATPRAGLDLTIVDGLADVDGVAAVVPMIQVAAQLDFLPADANGAERRIESEPVLVLGVDCRVQTLLGMAGCDPTVLQAAGDGALVIGPGLAPPAGTVASMRTDAGRIALAGAPVQADLAAINDGRVVVLSLEAAQRQFRQEGFADIAYVLPDDGADIDAVRSRLENAVGEQNAVLGIDDPPPETEIVLRAFIPLFSLLGLFGLGTGAVLVRNTVALSLEERRRQMAITAAIGGDGRTLVGGAIAEAAVLGFLGGLLGVAGGIAVAGPIVSGISEFTENIAGVKLDMHTPASVGVIGALLGIFVGAGAAIGPARRAARLDVAAELSGRSVVAESKPVRVVRRLALWSGVAALATLVCWLSQRDGGIERWQATVGPPAFLVVTVSLLLAGAALTPLLIGRLARALAGTRRSTWLLSMAELVRDPRRVGIMSVAIASPIVTGFATDGFVSSARESITTSFEDEDASVSVSTIDVNEGNDAFLSPEALARLRSLPEVADIERGRFVSAGQRLGDLVGVQTFDGFELDQDDYIRGTVDEAGFAAGEALIGPALARRTGARPGDTIDVPTPRGMVDLTVQAIVESGDSGGYAVFLHPTRFEALYGDRPAAFVVLRPADGVTEDELATAVRTADPPIDAVLRVQTTDQLVDDIVESIDGQMLPFRVMQQSLIVVAFVAVISTLLLAGLQRRREHGLLAAVGADPGSLRRVVLAEAGVVTGAAIVNALISGPVVLWTMLQVIPILIGVHNPFQADWGAFVASAVGALVISMLAAAWPAWRASRVEVLEALRYE